MTTTELAQSLRELARATVPFGVQRQTLDNGREYECCVMCGISPLRLAEALEALPNSDGPDLPTANDAIQP